MLSGLLSCDVDTKEVLGVAGVGDVIVVGDKLKLIGKDLTSEEEDIVDVDGND